MGIFETYYKNKQSAIHESTDKTNVVNEEVLDESLVLIEYIQELEEKLAVFVKGNSSDPDVKSRSPDKLKHEPDHASARKDAADKIRASRKATGASGSKLGKSDSNVSVEKNYSAKNVTPHRPYGSY